MLKLDLYQQKSEISTRTGCDFRVGRWVEPTISSAFVGGRIGLVLDTFHGTQHNLLGNVEDLSRIDIHYHTWV